MKSRRLDRVNELIRVELGSLILHHLRDPRLSQVVSITSVDVAADLRSAKVYVSVLGEMEDKTKTMKGLQAASGFLRRELGHRIALRNIPEIRFLLDDSIEEGAKVLDLIRRVVVQPPTSTGGSGPAVDVGGWTTL